jgi:DNA-binding NarL/FixJ family response regulator
VSGPRVAVAGGDALVRDVVRACCEADGIEIVGEADTSRRLIELCDETRPDVVISDSELADCDVVGSLGDVMARGARVVVVTGDDNPERLASLMTWGVRGVLLYDASPAHVADGVRAVAAGGAALHPTVARHMLDEWRELRESSSDGERRSRLTPRETQVLTALADGLSAKATARLLGMAVKTVENHKIHIFGKLRVRTQAHAVSVAIGDGLVAPTALSLDADG